MESLRSEHAKAIKALQDGNASSLQEAAREAAEALRRREAELAEERKAAEAKAAEELAKALAKAEASLQELQAQHAEEKRLLKEEVRLPWASHTLEPRPCTVPCAQQGSIQGFRAPKP